MNWAYLHVIINTSAWAPGMYHVKIFSSGQTSFRKVIKK